MDLVAAGGALGRIHHVTGSEALGRLDHVEGGGALGRMDHVTRGGALGRMDHITGGEALKEWITLLVVGRLGNGSRYWWWGVGENGSRYQGNLGR